MARSRSASSFQAVIDGIPHLEDVGLGSDAHLSGIGMSGSDSRSLRLIRRRYSRMTLRHTPFRKAPNSSVLRINWPCCSARKNPRQTLLDQIVNIGATVADMVQDLVAQLETQTINVRLCQGRFGRGVLGQIHGAPGCGTGQWGMANVGNLGFPNCDSGIGHCRPRPAVAPVAFRDWKHSRQKTGRP